MLLAGDEFRRTQGGNNNAYCQDNETSWIDWQFLEKHKDIFRFTRSMIAFRQAHPILCTDRFYTDAEIQWFDPLGELPDWADQKKKQLACMIYEEESKLYFMFNASDEVVNFKLPIVLPTVRWYLTIDTSLVSPQDFLDVHETQLLDNQLFYSVNARTSVVLATQNSE